MPNFMDRVRGIGEASRMTARGSKKPDTPAIGGKKKQRPPAAPKVPEWQNFRSNPRFRKAEQIAEMLVTAKNLRDSAAPSDTGLEDSFNNDADRLRDRLLELEQGLTKEEINELQRVSAGQGFPEGRKPARSRF